MFGPSSTSVAPRQLVIRTPTTALALIAGLLAGAFATEVVGADDANDPAERIAGSFQRPLEQRARAAGTPVGPARPATRRSARSALTAGGRRPKVLHGAGQPVTLAGGETSSISLRCPRRYPVPISAGLESSIPGIFPGLITRDPQGRRAMLVGAVNQTAGEGQWRATIVCLRGAKEAG